MRCIITLSALLFATSAYAAPKMSGEDYNRLVDSYNVMWHQHEMLAERHNVMVKAANGIIEIRNVLAADTQAQAQFYFMLREEIYDEFSLGRKKLRLRHPGLLIPPVIGEKGFEKDAVGIVKADVGKTKLKRIDGREMARLERGMAARLKGMAKRFSCIRNAVDSWKDDYAAVKDAWMAVLVRYGDLSLAWNTLKGRKEDLKLFKAMCANMACEVGDVHLAYGHQAK